MIFKPNTYVPIHLQWNMTFLSLVTVLMVSCLSFGSPTFAQSNKDDEQEVFDDKRGDVAIDQETLDKAENAFFEG